MAKARECLNRARTQAGGLARCPKPSGVNDIYKTAMWLTGLELVSVTRRPIDNGTNTQGLLPTCTPGQKAAPRHDGYMSCRGIVRMQGKDVEGIIEIVNRSAKSAALEDSAMQ
jgi:hypothetical protein